MQTTYMFAVDSGIPSHMPEHLERYWVHGKGALKIRWGQPKDFYRCVRQLRKYFPKNPKGLCNHLHQAALGVAPGQEHAMETVMTFAALFDTTADPHADCTLDTFCRTPLHKGPCKGFHRKGYIPDAPSAGGGSSTPKARAPRKSATAGGDSPMREMSKKLISGRRERSREDSEKMLAGLSDAEIKQLATHLEAQGKTRAELTESMLNQLHGSAAPKMTPARRFASRLIAAAMKGSLTREQTEDRLNTLSDEEIADLAPHMEFKKGPRKKMIQSILMMLHGSPNSRVAAALDELVAEPDDGPAEFADMDDDDDDDDELDPELVAQLPKKLMWRSTIAPLEKPTGDGRRIGQHAIEIGSMPQPILWQKLTGEGHKASVIVGGILHAVADPTPSDDYPFGRIMGEGDWLSTPEAIEAIELARRGLIKPSIDLDDFTFELRNADTGEKFDQDTDCTDGACVKQEHYVTKGRMRAATLVPIPAFQETDIEVFEVIDEDAVHAAMAARSMEFAGHDDQHDTDGENDENCGCDERVLRAVVASGVVVLEAPPASAFAHRDPGMLIPFSSEGDRIFGYFAGKSTCHTTYRHACVTPPVEPDYSLFHRYPQTTDDGQILTGRLTVGYGKMSGQCSCCPPADDHACLNFGLDDTIAHYDRMDTAAHVTVGRDQRGLWYAGVWAPGVSDAAKQIVRDRGLSGDWRMVDGQLRLCEVMGVSTGRPGFPVGKMSTAGQMALVAAGRVPTVKDWAVDKYQEGIVSEDALRKLVDQAVDKAAGRAVQRFVAAQDASARWAAIDDDRAAETAAERTARAAAAVAVFANGGGR